MSISYNLNDLLLTFIESIEGERGAYRAVIEGAGYGEI